MLRKIGVLLLICAMLLPLLGGETFAADSYLITVAEDTVLEDASDNGMAVYLDGIIYTPYTTIQKINGVWATYSAEKSMITVYSMGFAMYFEIESGLTYDYEGRYIQVSAKLRDGVPYLPIQIVCSWMNLYYSFITAKESGLGYPIIRLAAKTPALGNAAFLSRSETALRKVARERDRNSGLPVAEDPDEPIPAAPEPDARTISLYFRDAPEELSFWLDTLEGDGMPAVFFLPLPELETRGDCLRELTARGFCCGILLQGEDALAEARAGAEQIAAILHTRIRLVCPDRALTEEEQTALTEAGFVVRTPVYRARSDVQNARKFKQSLQKTLRDAGDGESLLLQTDARTQEVLPVLCSLLVAQNFTVRSAGEWMP